MHRDGHLTIRESCCRDSSGTLSQTLNGITSESEIQKRIVAVADQTGGAQQQGEQAGGRLQRRHDRFVLPPHPQPLSHGQAAHCARQDRAQPGQHRVGGFGGGGEHEVDVDKGVPQCI